MGRGVVVAKLGTPGLAGLVSPHMKLRIAYFIAGVILVALALVCSTYAEVAWSLESSAGGAFSLVLLILSVAYLGAAAIAVGLCTGHLADRLSLGLIAGVSSALAFVAAIPVALLFDLGSAPVLVGVLAFLLGLMPMLAYLALTREPVLAAAPEAVGAGDRQSPLE